jgi:hypothetical protein
LSHSSSPFYISYFSGKVLRPAWGWPRLWSFYLSFLYSWDDSLEPPSLALP